MLEDMLCNLPVLGLIPLESIGLVGFWCFLGTRSTRAEGRERTAAESCEESGDMSTEQDALGR